LDGILMQETDFPVEVLVHDDASTDSTPAILEEYRLRYPELIRIIQQSVNQRSRGQKILQLVVPECRGEFVAICEGDDYWTDPKKLQIQHDLLRDEPAAQICFHDCSTVGDENGAWVIKHETIWPRNEVTIEDLLNGNPAMTCSAFFSCKAFPKDPEFFRGLKMGDLPLWIIYSLRGRVLWIHRNMGNYRLHRGGSWSNKSQSQMHLEIFECIAAMGRLLPSQLSELHRSSLARHLARFAVHLDKEQEDGVGGVMSVPANQLGLGFAELEVFCTEYMNRSSWVFESGSETRLLLLKGHLAELGCSEEDSDTILSKYREKQFPEETSERDPSNKSNSWLGKLMEYIQRL